jgi:hypothetical protein
VVPQAAKAQQAEPSAECLEAPSEDVDDKEFDLVACWEEFDPELFIVKEPDSQSEAQSEPESEVKSELQSEPEAVSEPSMASCLPDRSARRLRRSKARFSIRWRGSREAFKAFQSGLRT